MKQSKRMTGAVIASAVALTMFPAIPRDVSASGIEIEDCFPDGNFRAYISDHIDTNGDSYLSDTEISAVTSLDVSGMSISSLEGIRYFSDLESLDCSGNNIDSLDLKYNCNLKSIICNNSNIRRISLFNIPDLSYLECYGNNIRLLDVSSNDLLCEAEDRASVSDPSLPSGVVKKYYEDLDVPEYGTLIYDDGVCVYTVSDNQDYIDDYNFPDENFRNYVLDQIDLNIDRELAPDEINFVENLDISNMGICDITGAEIFEYMTVLDCSNNPLGEIDLSILAGLEEIHCCDCGLTYINADNRTLKYLICYDNELTSIDLRCVPSLRSLNISYNQLTSLDISAIPYLSFLDYCGNRDLGWVDISSTTMLGVLRCTDCGVENVDLDGIDTLDELQCSCNRLTELDLGDNDLRVLACFDNDIESLDVSGCHSMWLLSCEDNRLSELDVSNNPDLLDLSCYHNDITELDLSNCPTMSEVYTTGTYVLNGDIHEYTKDAITREGNDFTAKLYIDDINVIATGSSNTPTPEPVADPTGQVTPGPAGPVVTPPSGNVSVVPTIVPTSGPSITPDSRPTGEPTLRPTGSVPGGDGPVITPATGRDRSLDGFIGRLYWYTLGREADAEGLQSWRDSVIYGTNTGADLARGFLFSPEFINAEFSNEEFVTRLYRTFFDREPDRAGFEGWVGALENGTSKQEIIDNFINSGEWANVCLMYGIRSGGTGVATVENEPNEATIGFATRLYTTCLGRNADQDGLMAWARQLANQRDTGSGAAWGFFFSEEFINQNVDNREYVTRLYRTFMDREPDQAGFDAWVSQLDSGVSREEVFSGFSASREYSLICAQYGIVRE